MNYVPGELNKKVASVPNVLSLCESQWTTRCSAVVPGTRPPGLGTLLPFFLSLQTSKSHRYKTGSTNVSITDYRYQKKAESEKHEIKSTMTWHQSDLIHLSHCFILLSLQLYYR